MTARSSNYWSGYRPQHGAYVEPHGNPSVTPIGLCDEPDFDGNIKTFCVEWKKSLAFQIPIFIEKGATVVLNLESPWPDPKMRGYASQLETTALAMLDVVLWVKKTYRIPIYVYGIVLRDAGVVNGPQFSRIIFNRTMARVFGTHVSAVMLDCYAQRNADGMSKLSGEVAREVAYSAAFSRRTAELLYPNKPAWAFISTQGALNGVQATEPLDLAPWEFQATCEWLDQSEAFERLVHFSEWPHPGSDNGLPLNTVRRRCRELFASTGVAS